MFLLLIHQLKEVSVPLLINVTHYDLLAVLLMTWTMNRNYFSAKTKCACK